jgi:hypothetical protein
VPKFCSRINKPALDHDALIYGDPGRT